ncbi:sporulation membrane protein YtaF [Bacillus sp. FJAT-45350]|uniref:sporulation membrane protein YtaF n=1 Tax=Bacillus sp. FJAT-45350 TaxID=2011014 RepID=UPI000BB6E853|nr:sporulation membrane protein YtaF [Bacillus sp. FJAT-45350]
MYHFFSIFLLVIAASIDNFGVGMVYGVRKIKVPFGSLLIIALFSAIVVVVSMLFGRTILQFISPDITDIISGCMLIVIGIINFYFLYKTNPRSVNNDDKKKKKKSDSTFLSVLKEPTKGDVDNTGVITLKEAVMLGIALAIDAFGVGLSAALLGYSMILTTLLISGLGAVFVALGIFLGMFLADKTWVKGLAYIPALLLILLGIHVLL